MKFIISFNNQKENNEDYKIFEMYPLLSLLFFPSLYPAFPIHPRQNYNIL